MTFSYQDDSMGNLEKVRFLVGDTQEKDRGGTRYIYVFEDEEINAILGHNGGSVYIAAADCIRAKVANLARHHSIVFSRGAGGSGQITLSVEKSRADLLKLAEVYEQRADSASVPDLIDWGVPDLAFVDTIRGPDPYRQDGGTGFEFAP